jgi:hypothetical protein
MSSGTARLKRRLDDQGINYTNKKAVENFCLVRLTATLNRGALKLTHISSRSALRCLPWRKRTRTNLFPYGNKMYARLFNFSLLRLWMCIVGSRREGPQTITWCLHRRLLCGLFQYRWLERRCVLIVAPYPPSYTANFPQDGPHQHSSHRGRTVPSRRRPVRKTIWTRRILRNYERVR